MTLLTDFFDSDDLSENVMYYVEAHGFLTSLAIQADITNQQSVLTEIFPDMTVNESITTAIISLQDEITQSLLNGDFPDTPTIDEDEDSLVLWCAGFMQGIFFQEQQWFAEFPNEVAELTLPILSCSELLTDELSDISQHDDVLDDMAEKIPDCVIDLYLLFNSPEQ